jgi:hypothetical protein
MTMKKKHIIDLSGPQGNAFYLLGIAKRICQETGTPSEKILSEMQSGDYENLVAVFEKYFNQCVTLKR